MGYTLRIGEARMDYDEDRVEIDCDLVTLPEAPAHGDPTDHQNQRWPSYSGWAESMEHLGLMDVMFNRQNGGAGEIEYKGTFLSPLLECHPGAKPITQLHLEYIAEKIDDYKRRHPDHVARYRPPKAGAQPMIPGSDMYREEDLDTDPRNDPWLCRGEWLLFWVRWAVENCKHPVFVNS